MSAEFEQAEAAYIKAQADFDEARDRLRKATTAFLIGLGSRAEVQAADAAKTVAYSRLLAAEAALDAAW